MILAGRGYGKTRTGSEVVRSWACGKSPLAAGQHRRFALVAETAADARDVLVEGESGILAVHPHDFRPLYEPSKRRLTWPNGATATLFNAVEPDQLRGPQHDAAWSDELAKWRYAREAWDQLQFGLRLGERPRQVITTTPRPMSLLKEIMARSDVVVTRGATMDNAGNLAPSFLTSILERYEGTRLGRQELSGELIEDVEGALWSRAMCEKARVDKTPDLKRIVVAVDPAVSANENSALTGIIVAGVGVDGKGYVIEDFSARRSPGEWAAVAVKAYDDHRADRIVAEGNQGGDMVRHTIETVRKNIPVTIVHASRGKQARAEPVVALYEQDKVKHVGPFPDLEDQLCTWEPLGSDPSPDRLDALVWALTNLMLGHAQLPDLGVGVVQVPVGDEQHRIW